MAPRDRGEARVPVPLPGVAAGARAGVGKRHAIGLAHALAPVLAKRGFADLSDPGRVAVAQHPATDPRSRGSGRPRRPATSVGSRGARSSERRRASSETRSLEFGKAYVRSVLDPPELLALCPTSVAQQ